MAKKSGLDAFVATMRRNPVYASREGLSGILCGVFAEEADKLINKSPYKEGGVGDSTHIANIERLRVFVTRRCGGFLKNGELRFGAAQKFLNVELKRRWLDEKYGEPPHCPFDSIVINALRRNLEDGVCTSWTKCNSRKCYWAWVRALRKTIGAESLAEWERRFWEDNR